MFIGDNGQGDITAGLKMIEIECEEERKVNGPKSTIMVCIHNVCNDKTKLSKTIDIDADNSELRKFNPQEIDSIYRGKLTILGEDNNKRIKKLNRYLDNGLRGRLLFFNTYQELTEKIYQSDGLKNIKSIMKQLNKNSRKRDRKTQKQFKKSNRNKTKKGR